MHRRHVPLIDGMPSISEWYKAEDVIGKKRQWCAATIRKMANCILPNLFVDQRLLYANAQRLSIAATLETVTMSTTVKAESSENASVSENPVAQQSTQVATLETTEPEKPAPKRVKIEADEKPSTYATATRRETRSSTLNIISLNVGGCRYRRNCAAESGLQPVFLHSSFFGRRVFG